MKNAQSQVCFEKCGGKGRLFRLKRRRRTGLHGDVPNVGFQTSAVLERIAPVLCLKCDEMGIFFTYIALKNK